MTAIYQTARAVLHAALVDVLPGRVYAYPPSHVQAAVAPAVWLGRPDGEADDTSLWRVDFPVRVVVNGADRAAEATLDELRSAVYLAARADVNCEVGRDAADDFYLDGGTTILPSAVFTIGVVVHASTWCPPIPEPALFPPAPIGV